MFKTQKVVFFLIVANEFCERYCYYGFRALLFQFLREVYSFSESSATEIFHLFNFSCYLFTFFGGVVSDAYLGRYKTILYLSLVYLVGTMFTTYSAVVINKNMLWLGLFLISIGTGGIKPCISVFGGDQFTDANSSDIESFFYLFYFSINSGSLLSIFITPILANMKCFERGSCYALAFVIPSFLLVISLILFVSGSKYYIKKAPCGKFYIKLSKYAFHAIKEVLIGSSSNDLTKNLDPQFYHVFCEFLRILKLFTLIPFYWMIYDQQSTSWVEQSMKMNTKIKFFSKAYHIIPSQMQAFNGVLVLLFIPLFTKFVIPFFERCKFDVSHLRRMYLGMIIASLSFLAAAVVESFIDNNIHILYQIPQYILLTVGEILLAMTGIEWVYTQAPSYMKGLLSSFWLVTVAIGNLYVIMFTHIGFFKWIGLSNIGFYNYLFYAGVGLTAAFYFNIQAKAFKRGK